MDDQTSHAMLEMTTIAVGLPLEEQATAVAGVFLTTCSRTLEDATLHGQLDDARARLLNLAEKCRKYVTEWIPVAPEDIPANPDTAKLPDKD